MPELPEVETVRLQLLSKITNLTIKKVKVLNIKTTRNNSKFARDLTGKTFSHIDRIGKLLIFEFKNEPDLFLLSHLKMTGQFFYQNKTRVIIGGGHSMTKEDSETLPNKHTRVYFELSNGSALFFNDMRKFGYLALTDLASKNITKSGYGPEPTATAFDYKKFYSGLSHKSRPIKAVLLDQTFIAGLGNIYVDEALFAAKIHPEKIARTLTFKEAKAVSKVGGEIMLKSIASGGTTFQNFKDTGGQNGNYKDYLKVFGKQNTPCPRCRTIIKKIKVAGRGTHYCPQCQK